MYKEGSIIKGKVSNIKEYGVFVNFDGGYSGLIHISEISDDFVKNINDFINEDEEIFVRVVSVDKGGNRLELSVKNLNYLTGDEKTGKIMETKAGFNPLKSNMSSWIKERINSFSSIDKKN